MGFNIKRSLLLAGGIASLTLGTIGVFLPVLPTTPFYLLGTACLLRSSKSLYYKIIRNRFFGPAILSYLEHRTVSVKSKVISLIALWTVMSLTMIFFTDQLWLRLLLSGIGAGVTIHLLLLKLNRKEPVAQENHEIPDLKRDGAHPGQK